MSTLKEFAEAYRVKVKNTGTETVAPGKHGEIADDYGDGWLRLRLIAVPPSSARGNRALATRAKAAHDAGMHLHQRAGYESIWLFRPNNQAHCRLAIKLASTRRKRQVILSPEQKAALRNRLAEIRPHRTPQTVATTAQMPPPCAHMPTREATSEINERATL